MTQFDKLIDTIDGQIAQAAADLNLDSEDFECITSVPGIGLLSGSVLLGLFQRLAERGADAVIAFLGLDPRPMDSGQKVGQRRLSKRGPSESRRLLFNAAMSASRTKAWRAHYEREPAKGLSTTARETSCFDCLCFSQVVESSAGPPFLDTPGHHCVKKQRLYF